MARRIPERWVWLVALGVALLLHLATLPEVSRWISQAFAERPQPEALVLDLSQMLLPKPPPKPQPKDKDEFKPLPEREKKLSEAPDKIDPKAMSSAPQAGGAKELGTELSKAQGQGMAEIERNFKNDGPLSTGEEGLNYAINNYQWNFERFMENWAIALSRRWLAPADYLKGLHPDGGEVWVKVVLNQDGSVEGFEVMRSNVSEDMTAMVVYAVNGVRTRPPLPSSFPEEQLVAYWKFIYPTYAQLKAMIEAQQKAQQAAQKTP